MGKSSKKHLHPVQPATTPAATPESGNGHGADVPKYDVGTSVPVPMQSLDGIAPALSRIGNIQQQLGALTEDFEMRRGQLLHALVEQRQAYGEQVKQLGLDLGLNLGPESKESWMFDPQRKVFTRQA
jgi:hypothetical protein